MLSIIAIAWDAICARRRATIAVVLMSTFAIYLCSLVLAESISLSAGERQYENSFASRKDKTLIIQPVNMDVSSAFLEGWSSFQNSVLRVEGCQKAGAFLRRSIIPVQADKTDLKSETEALNVLYIDETILDLCRTSLLKEDKLKLSQDSSYVPLYVGIEYAIAYPVGTFFTYQGREYRVEGVLSKQSRWISTMGIVNNGEVCSLEKKCVTSTRFAEPLPYYGMNGMYVILDDGKDIDAIRAALKQRAEENGIQVTVKTIEEYIRKERIIRKNSEKNYLQELLVVLVVSLISASAINIVGLLFRKREVGIFYACGYRGKDIMLSMLFETMIKMLMSFALWFAVQSLCSRWGLVNIFSIVTGEKILFLTVFVFLIAILFAATTVCSVLYLIFKNPIEMLED